MQIRKIVLAFCSCNFMIYNAYVYDLWTFIYLLSKLGIFWVLVYHVNNHRRIMAILKPQISNPRKTSAPCPTSRFSCPNCVDVFTPCNLDKVLERNYQISSSKFGRRQVVSSCGIILLLMYTGYFFYAHFFMHT